MKMKLLFLLSLLFSAQFSFAQNDNFSISELEKKTYMTYEEFDSWATSLEYIYHSRPDENRYHYVSSSNNINGVKEILSYWNHESFIVIHATFIEKAKYVNYKNALKAKKYKFTQEVILRSGDTSFVYENLEYGVTLVQKKDGTYEINLLRKK